MFSIDASQLNRLAASFDAAGDAIGVEASTAVRATALRVERDAKAFAPVDTGFLRNSIGHDITGNADAAAIEAEIGPTAAYSEFVEFGTSRMAPRAFMGPALDRNAPGFVAAMDVAVAKAMQRAGL